MFIAYDEDHDGVLNESEIKNIISDFFKAIDVKLPSWIRQTMIGETEETLVKQTTLARQRLAEAPLDSIAAAVTHQMDTENQKTVRFEVFEASFSEVMSRWDPFNE